MTNKSKKTARAQLNEMNQLIGVENECYAETNESKKKLPNK